MGREKQKELDRIYMDRALQLAKKGYGSVSPNPYVGAVIVKDGKIIAEGHHHESGKDHAEIDALNNATESVVGATIYVSLEPCCHIGRTSACTDAIIQSGIKRVVTAMEDPNPLVAGKGHEILRQHHIEVNIADFATNEAKMINRVFIHNQQQKRTYVTLKTALSLDGKLATQTFDSQWITGAKAREYAHYLRGLHDLILIGKGTLIADDPTLNVRYGLKTKMPTRAVVINNFTGIEPHYKCFDTSISPSIILYPKAITPPPVLSQQLVNQGVQLFALPATSPSDITAMLFQKGFMSLLIEGGAQLYDSFLNAELVNEFALFYGPRLIGNSNALELWKSSPTTVLNDAPYLEIKHLEKLEESFYVQAFPQGGY